jgi:hypothetical protein
MTETNAANDYTRFLSSHNNRAASCNAIDINGGTFFILLNSDVALL